MAYICENCGKSSDYGHNVSHAKNRTKRKRKPNLHKVRVIEDGSIVRKKLCTRCIRAAQRPGRKSEKDAASQE